MSKWTPKLREKAYILCRDRDGEKCHGHGAITCGGRTIANPATNPLREISSLTVDHIDNNSSNNPADGSNWQLLCASCNNKKRQMPKTKTKSIDKFKSYKNFRSLLGGRGTGLKPEKDTEYAKEITREMELNLEAEPEFRKFTEDALTSLSYIRELDLLNAGAMNHFKVFAKNISQRSLKRYLDKWINPVNGDMERFKLDDAWHIRRIKNKENTGESQ